MLIGLHPPRKVRAPMPLRLNLRPYEQIMINGAVITNLRRRSFLAIHNHARIIPGKFILKASRAVTPVRRIYFAAQMAYVFSEDPDQFQEWVEEFDSRMAEVIGITNSPEVLGKLAESAGFFQKRIFYKSLRLLQEVMEYEEKLLVLAGTPPPPAFGDGLNPPQDGEDDPDSPADDTL